MGHVYLPRKGGAVIERTANPNINVVSLTATSITVTFKNNENAEVDLFYGTTTPPTTKITLAANATSSNQTISGLTDATAFDIYAYAIVTDATTKKIKSEIVETEVVTAISTPTITQVSKTESSITFTVRNNSSKNGDVVYGLTSPPDTTTLALNSNTTSANQTISGLSPNQTVTVFAQTKVDGFVDSEIASSQVTTNPITYTAATGGTTNEYNASGKRFRSHRFNSSGTFTVTTAGDAAGDRNKVEFIIVAGGGGGGGRSPISGGGGGGGYISSVVGELSGANSAVIPKQTVTATSYTVNVGLGGAGGPVGSASQNGFNSSITFPTTITAIGGGGGGTSVDTPLRRGADGGCGGGGFSDSGSGVSKAGGSGTANQGFGGGIGVNGAPERGGGGGGAAGAGVNGASGSHGGAAITSSITGSSIAFSGGGGGGSRSDATPGTGGTNAGNGQANYNNGGNGVANRGGGGGGTGTTAGVAGTGGNGGNGGSGIVVIRYEIAP